MKVRSSIGRTSAPQADEAGSISPPTTGRLAVWRNWETRGPQKLVPRGVGVRISPWRLNPFQAGRCPAGPHKPGVPGSIPGPGIRGWAGARPSFIRLDAEVRLPEPQLPAFTARYANWHRGQV